MRLTRGERALIDQAAALLGKKRSEFMLDAARREAENTLLDRVIFQLDQEAFSRFSDLLDNPPPATDELRAFLAAKAPWE
jgi:uncharacterized protein (DUF1778 family)